LIDVISRSKNYELLSHHTSKGLKMNKKIIGISIAMLFAANGAYAQSTNGSSVELYGILDAAVGNVEYSLAADPNFPATVNPVTVTKTPVNQSTTGMFNGGISPSRWGIRGTEDLGAGFKAIFNLDSYFNINSGDLSNAAASMANNRNTTSGTVSAPSSVNGQLFNDQAWVGLADDTIGSLTFGRQWSVMGDILRNYDAVQDAQLFSPLGFSGTYAGGGLTELKRQDSSVKYQGKFGDFNVAAMVKLGGEASSSTIGSAYGISGGYEAYGFGVQLAYQQSTDTLHGSNDSAATVNGSVNTTNYDTDSFMVAAKYAFGDAKITGGYESYTLKAPSDAYTTWGPSTYYGYQIGTNTDFADANQTTHVIWIGGDYNFTPAFNLAVGFYDLAPQQSSDYTAKSNGEVATGQANGNEYEYSLLADYHFSKRTDAYFGVMYSQFKGNQYPSVEYNTNNVIYAVGMRTKF
jgi:predicted porin